MKSKKRIFAGLCACILLMVTMLVGIQTPVSAAVAGSTYSNPVVLSSGVWMTKVWTNDNDHLNYYNKITVPSRGYITIVIEKPLDSEGECGDFYLELYTIDGKLAWATNTNSQKDTFSEYYRYNLGLDAGTYFLNMDPGFYLYSYSAPISHSYMYQYTKALDWEIEPNGNLNTATEIALGKTYYGVYTEESYSTSYKDYYKVNLTKDVNYIWTVTNWDELDPTTTIFYVYDEYGSEVYSGWGTEGADNVKINIVPTYSGWYYLCLGNCGNRKDIDYSIRVDENTTPISELEISLSDSAYTYNGKVRVPTVTVKDADGETVSPSNYTVTKVTNCKYPGTHSIKVTMKGNYTGSKTLTYKINPINISKCTVKLSATSSTYDGKVKTPSVVVKNANGTTLTKGTHYTVTYASDRKNVGTYKVTVKMKGNYTGTKTLTFNIIPAKTAITKITNSGTTAKLYWKAKTAQATGYQVQYSASSKFTSAKTKNITSYKTSSVSLSGISKTKTTYIRIRTYKTVGGTKHYSLWKTYKYSKGKLTEI